MKKHNYLNKSQKLLLATMTIPLAVSILPITENVVASEVPTLNIYDLDGSPKLEWATEILQENIIENVDIDSALHLNLPNHYINNSSIIYEGINPVLKFTRSYGGLGNGVWYPATESDSSLTYAKNSYLFEKGTKLTMSMKIKSKGESIIEPISEGYYFDELPQAGKVSREINPGDSFFYTELSTVNDFKLGDRVVNYRDEVNLGIAFAFITEIDTNTGKITLDRAMNEASHNVKYNVGDSVTIFERNSIFFDNRTINNANEWTNLNFNTVLDSDNYDYSRKPFKFIIRSHSEEELLIKDIVLAHATEVEVYRNGQSIYKGFLSDFQDTTVRDTVKPDKVKNINASIDENLNANFTIVKPLDNGTKTSYQIQSIAKNGTRSSLSAPQEIEIKTDVVKYKYSISKSSTNNVTNELSANNKLSLSLKSINLETDYLHIQAIDANGNEGDIESFKLSDIVDTSNLNNVYDKLKELEETGSDDEFLDFVQELEGLYGDNLPQDIIDRLNDLANKKSLHTSFLLLEEGDFRLSTSDINSFGSTNLTAKKQTLTTAFKGDFGVIDARGTQEGWNVSVSATPFTVETFDGFLGVPHQLPIGSLALNTLTTIEQVGQVHNSQLPDITLNQLSVIDGSNQALNLLNADKHKGMGEFKFTFGTDALTLTVDAVTAKIDNVNYPNQNTPYTSTVTWNLVSGPQI